MSPRLASGRAESLGDWSELSLASALRTAVYAAPGDAAVAEDEGACAAGRWVAGRRLRVGADDPAPHARRPARRAGDAAGVARPWSGTTPAVALPRPFRLLVALGLGRPGDAPLAVRARPSAPADLTALTLVGHCAYAAAAAELGERDAAAWAADDLLSVAEAGVLLPIGWNLLGPRVLAAGAAWQRPAGRGAAPGWAGRSSGRRCRAPMPSWRAAGREGPAGERRGGRWRPPGGAAERRSGREHRLPARSRPPRWMAVELGLSLGRFPGDVALGEGEAAGAAPPSSARCCSPTSST